MSAPVGGVVAEVLAVLDAEIASLPVMAEMATHNGVACDATDAIARLTEARAAVAELAESHAELLAWVERAIVPGYTDRKPMPENCRKAIARSVAALAHFQTGGAE